jgi:hypothetical protein
MGLFFKNAFHRTFRQHTATTLFCFHLSSLAFISMFLSSSVFIVMAGILPKPKKNQKPTGGF